MLNGHVFQQVLWAPATAGTAGGLLPTPTTQDTIAHSNAIITANNRSLSRAGSTHSLNLQDALTLPTPTTQEWKRRGPNSSQQGLSNTENWMLPTPTTNDSKNASLPPSQADRNGLAGAMLRNDSIPTGPGTHLNPSFVEEMMGFPVGWTALKP
jgi:DNA (cytosine-5)-methyltransferase 1